MSTHETIRQAFAAAETNGTRAWLVTVSPVGQDNEPSRRNVWVRFGDDEATIERTSKAAAQVEGVRVRRIDPITREDLWTSYSARFVAADGSTVATETLDAPDDRSARSWAAGARHFHEAEAFVLTETATGRRVG